MKEIEILQGSSEGSTPPSTVDDPIRNNVRADESSPWFSISWLFAFLILHSLGVGLYIVVLRVQGVVDAPHQIEEYLMRPESLPGLVFYGWIFVIPALILAARSSQRSWRQGLALVRFSPRQLPFWLLILMVYLLFETLAVKVLQISVGEFMEQMVGQKGPLLILSIVVFAPVAEELLFRGYLFNAWRHSRIGLSGTLLLSSFLFALVHWGQYGVVPLFFIFGAGLLMGVARETSGSVYLPMILHGLANLVSVIMVNYLGLV
ncbi:CPBP family intramembrane glutamic endopeptidase [Microbulbifer sp. YPW1]|uniref:CPBP family intramembrane glutamic endopeptidase n=1 Tax=Microbulbifer sp. YPW1 TaxID=2745199 RepID=UPI001597210D|nr:type II CAAX endopeptidase family protein [Microbulbifer sp. YPW1]QKX17056.1 CPBP family intramembrane metalloprotease [Microbulbifer sp. YPW1]